MCQDALRLLNFHCKYSNQQCRGRNLRLR
uniref:Uncharacterized protein n=1 Tax=Rhizophora mucronata TaxID=61149 RepID=A0A2P2NRD0_RHIMU